ncbi:MULTISPECIES: spore germination protein [Clostridium]|uniref:Spore germination protein B1 n=1 Tax=Clostridium ragsdalei P11 TaxID=1353534 RepID=A0A1A6B1I3_9CLOT|nr:MULTISPECIES: spore germination protein [Clostridium]OBR96194.1 spore germination protein B1 [Clostridium ragsdalei P11]QXE18662.1 spore germination protein [Clostridium sp. 001]
MKKFFNSKNTSDPIYVQKLSDDRYNLPLNKSLSNNLNVLHELFSNCADVVYHKFVIHSMKCSCVLIFFNGLSDIRSINESILPSIMNIKEVTENDLKCDHTVEIIKKYFLQITKIGEVSTIGQITNALLNGNTILLLDGDDMALEVVTPGWKEKDVSETDVEKIIRGPNEGFTQNISINISQLRRKIKSPELKVEDFIIGKQTQTKISISYLQGIVDNHIVEELKERIGKINIDSILESGYIEELIEDTHYTLFPQIQHSERPDRVAAGILEGRVAVLVDGTPCVLILPATLIQFLQTSEDYYERYTTTIFVHFIRLIFFVLSLLLPGCFVAIILYHKEMIPTPLLISIMGAAHGVPFPIFIEALLMETAFEALREAGIRLPSPANQTVGIVGALVIGDAAVRAGVTSPIMVIVIAITAIASFSIPSYDMGYAIRILRFSMLCLGAFLGLYGILLGIIILLIHLSSLSSFGVNYLSPLAPLNLKDLKDTLIRFPWPYMKCRPHFANANNLHRQKSSSENSKDEKG